MLDGESSHRGRPCVLSFSGACRKASTSQLGAPVLFGGLGCLLKELFIRDQHFSLIKPPPLSTFPSLEENPVRASGHSLSGDSGLPLNPGNP